MNAVQEFISITPWTIIFQICNLLILVLLVKKFLWQRVMAVLDQRQQEIDGIYDAAGKDRSDAQQMKEEYTRRMSNAREEADRLVKNAELLHMEYDAGHSVQSHTWEHATSGATKRKNARWEQKTNETMGRLIGAVPVMMRPPGGHWRNYREAGCEMPMILWSVSSADALTDETDDDVIHCFGVAAGAGDGDIVLFHDIKRIAGKLAERCMERYEAEDILLVTVNDLCALRGIPLEKDLLLESCPGEGKDPGGNEPPAADGAPEHIGSSDDS